MGIRSVDRRGKRRKQEEGENRSSPERVRSKDFGGKKKSKGF